MRRSAKRRVHNEVRLSANVAKLPQMLRKPQIATEKSPGGAETGA